jgi:hypothetical protein
MLKLGLDRPADDDDRLSRLLRVEQHAHEPTKIGGLGTLPPVLGILIADAEHHLLIAFIAQLRPVNDFGEVKLVINFVNT